MPGLKLPLHPGVGADPGIRDFGVATTYWLGGCQRDNLHISFIFDRLGPTEAGSAAIGQAGNLVREFPHGPGLLYSMEADITKETQPTTQSKGPAANVESGH